MNPAETLFKENDIEFTVEDVSQRYSSPKKWLWWTGPLTTGYCDCRGTHVSISRQSGWRELFPEEFFYDCEREPEDEYFLTDIQEPSLKEIIENLAGEKSAKKDAGHCSWQPFSLDEIGLVNEDYLEEDHKYWLPEVIKQLPYFGPTTLMLREMFAGRLHLLFFTESQQASVLGELRHIQAVIERESITQEWL